jgi:ribonucleoside-diphosphate reductase alpha chain
MTSGEVTFIATNGLKITINEDNNKYLTDFGMAVIKDRYTVRGETIQEAFARTACAFADSPEHAQRLYNYVSKLWFMFASPLLSNGGTDRGLAISCFLNYVGDSRESLASNFVENVFLSTNGGGIGTYFGAVRSNGSPVRGGVSQSTGVIPFLKVIDSQMLAYQQGKMRRGSAAVYLDISHPEIREFINIRKPTGGDPNRKCLNLHNAVNITDKFMQAVKEGAKWDLIDPHSELVMDTVDARSLWIDLLKLRMETGEPYLNFIDTANKALPEPLKKLGLKIHSSNLCNEIMLPTNEERTAVCCLSSVNLEKFDEWKDDELFIEDLMRMLDNVLEDFINTAPKEMHKAVNSARSERSVGLGAMGFHSYLQSKSVPFESAMAQSWNKRMFKHMFSKSFDASIKLGTERGEAPDMKGTGHRFAHRHALAPNANSGIMCGNTSPSIEPYRANIFNQKTLTGTFTVKNRNLERLLEEKGLNTKEVWSSITANRGSVQHLDSLSSEEKDVFKTAIELDQDWIIQHASDRQIYICQGQSVNLFFSPEVDINTLHKVHYNAWHKGLKGLYYLRSETLQRVENVVTTSSSTATPIVVNASNLSNEMENLQSVEEEPSCLGCSG